MAKQRKSLEEIEKIMTGGEPKFTAEVVSETDMSQALNWYSQNRDTKQAIKYINDYLKKNKIKVAADIINRQVPTYGFICRMKTNGAVLSEKYETKFQDFIEGMKSAVSKPVVEKVEEKKPVVSIQDRVLERTREIAGEVEGSIDDYILSDFKKAPSPYGIMHSLGAKGMHATKMLDWFKKRRSEFDEVLTTKDEQLIEGYSNFTKVQLKKLVAYCDQIITDCTKIAGEAKVSRKPRKRKEKSPDQLVAKVQLLDKSDEFNLTGEPTKDIIGATCLWVFNVKYKRLGVYHASDSQGFGVKGTSLTNFSEMKSIQKTLRKPNDVLPNVVKGGKVFLRNIMSELTTKETPLNGRLNKETILIKVIK